VQVAAVRRRGGPLAARGAPSPWPSPCRERSREDGARCVFFSEQKLCLLFVSLDSEQKPEEAARGSGEAG